MVEGVVAELVVVEEEEVARLLVLLGSVAEVDVVDGRLEVALSVEVVDETGAIGETGEGEEGAEDAERGLEIGDLRSPRYNISYTFILQSLRTHEVVAVPRIVNLPHIGQAAGRRTHGGLDLYFWFVGWCSYYMQWVRSVGDLEQKLGARASDEKGSVQGAQR